MEGGEVGMGGFEGSGEGNGTAGFRDEEDGEAGADAVCGGEADAEVESQAGDDDALEAAFAEVAGETRGGGAVIFKEGGVGVDLRAEAFAEDELGVGDVEAGVEFRTGGALDAVGRPQGLGAVGHLDGLIGGCSGVAGGKGEMVGGMPVLGEDDVGEVGGEAVDGGEDLVAEGDGECAAGAEVALDVDDEEEVGGSDGHDVARFRKA